MEEYKRNLCSYFGNHDMLEDIKDDPRYKYKLNEDGKLHSNYTGSYYEPAIIFTVKHITCLYWLFDGEIKDCNHPFRITLMHGRIEHIQYYSSERIQKEEPILIAYDDGMLCSKSYNQYCSFITNSYVKILDDFDHGHRQFMENEYIDESLFTPECYPLCDPLNLYMFKLKFAD